jgi:hypothetical protein
MGNQPMFGPEITRRPVLASYDRYDDAQKAVDTLSDNGFPVQNVAIVGVDLRMVEAVLGRWSWGRSALSGMGTGAWLGLLLGLFVSLFVEADSGSSQLIFMGLLYGAAFGIIFGLISYAFTRGRRDFVSRQSLVAARYDVLCEADVLYQARQILAGRSKTWPPPLPPSAAGPPSPDDRVAEPPPEPGDPRPSA